MSASDQTPQDLDLNTSGSPSTELSAAEEAPQGAAAEQEADKPRAPKPKKGPKAKKKDQDPTSAPSAASVPRPSLIETVKDIVLEAVKDYPKLTARVVETSPTTASILVNDLEEARLTARNDNEITVDLYAFIHPETHRFLNDTLRKAGVIDDQKPEIGSFLKRGFFLP